MMPRYSGLLAEIVNGKAAVEIWLFCFHVSQEAGQIFFSLSLFQTAPGVFFGVLLIIILFTQKHFTEDDRLLDAIKAVHYAKEGDESEDYKIGIKWNIVSEDIQTSKNKHDEIRNIETYGKDFEPVKGDPLGCEGSKVFQVRLVLLYLYERKYTVNGYRKKK